MSASCEFQNASPLRVASTVLCLSFKDVKMVASHAETTPSLTIVLLWQDSVILGLNITSATGRLGGNSILSRDVQFISVCWPLFEYAFIILTYLPTHISCQFIDLGAVSSIQAFRNRNRRNAHWTETFRAARSTFGVRFLQR
jgi:hypothetical protein